MKNSGFKWIALLMGFAMISMFTSQAIAQGSGRGRGMGPGDGKGNCLAAIPGLTEEQRTAIDQLRAKHIRKAELVRAEIGEKEARMNTLKLAEKPDEKAIDNNIDEISKLRGDLMKEREAHQREVKALLTDEQKAFYDARPRKGRGNGYGNNRQGKQGRNGRGMGYGPGNSGNCPYAK